MSELALDADRTCIESARQALAVAADELADAFRSGAQVSALLRRRATACDQQLKRLWAHVGLDLSKAQNPLALLAVGGYGRGQLHPHSDLDLLVLSGEPLSPDREVAVERFIGLVFQLNLDIGHSVRSLEDCVARARDDLTIITSLIEARCICGDHELLTSLQRAIAPGELWSSRDFHEAKVAEQVERHHHFDNADYNLEPNVKSSPGGLRDIQTIAWVTRRHFGTSDPRHLMTLGFVTRNEHDALVKGEAFLSRVRFGLHVLARRAENRLTFDRQQELAILFGYEDQPGQLAVEQLMHDYYRHVLEVQALNDMLLQHFTEALFDQTTPSIPPEVINDRFQVTNDYLELRHADGFNEDPGGLMEIFVILAQRSDLRGVRAATIRQIREHLDLIDDGFRADPKNNALFMRLLRAPHNLVSQLTRMRRYGVLGRYLPEFGAIIGQMQHDLFHIYTVDTHTMQLIRNLRRFVSGVSRDRFPVACQCVTHLYRMELVYVAGLYHDIGKGRGGDHSTLGAVDARAFCQRHGLTDEETEIIAWLVENHLVMSTVAQRQDISDPNVVLPFATNVGTLERLDLLYALTVADITATNPTLWNGWRASLLQQLYAETRGMLLAGIATPVTRRERIERRMADALIGLEERGITRAEAEAVWQHVDEDYFLQNMAADIVWQTQAMHGHDLSDGPLVLIRNSSVMPDARGLATAAERRAGTPTTAGAMEILLFTKNQPNLFAGSVAALDRVGLSVQDARIHTSGGDVCVNTYAVLDETREAPRAADYQAELAAAMTEALADPEATPRIITKLVPTHRRHFSLPTHAEFLDEPNSQGSRLRVIATDWPGLLARLGTLLMEHDLQLHSARISTLGERVEDTFDIGEADGTPITDPARRDQLTKAICERLDETVFG